MPNVTTVHVEFGRKIQTRPYENAEAKVGLTIAYDQSEKATDIDSEIAEAMARANAHVESALGIAPSEEAALDDAIKATKPKAEPKKEPAKKAAKAAEPDPLDAEPDPLDAPAPEAKPAAKKEAAKPARAAEPDPFDAPAGDDTAAVEEPTTGDVNAAVGAFITRCQSKGIADGPAQIGKLVRAYLPDNAEPPYSTTKLPAHCRADFIKDINERAR